MNTGIGDAVNLAWKLAVVVKGDAADMLLDTYQGERIAFARRLVATTDRAFQLISRDDWIARFMRLELIPAILPILFRWRAVRRLMFLTISQTNINYRGLGLAEGRAGSVRGGDRLPWVEGTDNFEPLRKLAWHAQAHGEPDAGAAEACARAGLDFVRFPWTQAADRVGIRRGAIHVVRPDGYVAAVTEGGAEDVLAGLQERFALKF